jgi:hypothetical protein
VGFPFNASAIFEGLSMEKWRGMVRGWRWLFLTLDEEEGCLSEETKSERNEREDFQDVCLLRG